MEGPAPTLERLAKYFFAGAWVLCLPALCIPLGLPAEADAADYRVPLMQWVIRHQAIPNWAWTPVDNYPMFGEFLMLPLRWLHPGWDRLVPMLAYGGIGLVAGALFRRIAPQWGMTGFWVTAALVVGFRPVVLQADILMVDNIASVWVLAALLLILHRREGLAGLVFGLGLATRYSVWPLLPVLGIACRVMGREWRVIGRFMLAAMVPVLPHLVRNCVIEGNPVFPLFTSILGPHDLTLHVGWDNYGRGSALTGLVLLPFDLLFTNEVSAPFFDYTLGRSALFVLVLAGGYGLAKPQHWREACASLRGKRETSGLLVFALGGLGLWAMTGAQLRFAVPELVVLAVLVIAILLRVASRAAVLTTLLAGCLTIVSVQKEMLLIVGGWRPPAFQEAAERARQQIDLAKLGPDVPIGWTARDRALGFLNRDFAYVGPHPYALGADREPALEWQYDPDWKGGTLRLVAPAASSDRR